MSNDKVAATYHGLPMTCCWMAKHTNGADHVRMCENFDQPLVFRETTGEHTKAKLADDLYGGRMSIAEASFGMSQLGQHTGSTVPGVPSSEERYANAYMRSLGPPLRPKPAVRRGWSPTHRELLYAGGLALAMLAFAVYFFLTHPM